MKRTPCKGEGRRDMRMMKQAWTHVWTEVQTRVQVHVEDQGSPALVYPPLLVQETPLGQEEIIRRIVEAEWLGKWGGCHSHHQPNSWPRWLWRLGHLCWVGKSHLERSSILLWEANPWEGVLDSWKAEEGPEVPTGDSGSL